MAYAGKERRDLSLKGRLRRLEEKTIQVGTMKQPGPLYGMSSHVWSALAVALTVGKMGPGSP